MVEVCHCALPKPAKWTADRHCACKDTRAPKVKTTSKMNQNYLRLSHWSILVVIIFPKSVAKAARGTLQVQVKINAGPSPLPFTSSSANTDKQQDQKCARSQGPNHTASWLQSRCYEWHNVETDITQAASEALPLHNPTSARPITQESVTWKLGKTCQSHSSTSICWSQDNVEISSAY